MSATGTYQFNNNNLPSPTIGDWNIPDVRGENGGGQKRYDRYFSFEINWNYMDYSDFNGLMNVWKGHYNSGTAVVNLPMFQNTQWYFQEYSGVVVDRPEFNQYYNTHYRDVKVMIRKIAI